MDRIVEVKVNGTHVWKDSQYAGVQGEANATYLRIEFDEGWDGFAKTITWLDAKGENPTGRVLTAAELEDIKASTRIYLTPIVPEALAIWGKCMFSIDGYINGRRQRSAYASMVVKPKGNGEDITIEEPTPSQIEQLQAQIDTLLGDISAKAQNAAASEQNAKAYAEGGYVTEKTDGGMEVLSEVPGAKAYMERSRVYVEGGTFPSGIDGVVTPVYVDGAANEAAKAQAYAESGTYEEWVYDASVINDDGTISVIRGWSKQIKTVDKGAKQCAKDAELHANKAEAASKLSEEYAARSNPEHAVRYTPQDLTEAQKEQARENIGAIDRATSHFNVIDFNAQQTVLSARLSGPDKSANNPIIQTEEAESTIFMQNNEGVVEHLRVSNKYNYPNKIGIDAAYPAQRLGVYDTYIEPNYAIGVRLPTGYYSQFNACWISGETGISIGHEDGSGWIGVLDFNACHFGDSKVAVKVNTRDTNTICLDKCCFEGADIAIENNGILYVRNTYVGDQVDTGNPQAVLVARPGSETHFDNCTVGVSFYENGGRRCLFDLRADEDNGPSTVYLTGGRLALSNNFNLANTKSSLYATDDENNLIFVDFVKFIPSTINYNHNQVPFYIYDGFTPLRSRFPLRNYVCNGTMKSALGNALLLEASKGAAFDAAMTNPFGGSVLRSKTAKFFYKVPKHFVGQQMTLEFYLYTENPSGFMLTSEGLGDVSWRDAFHLYEDERRPVMYRVDVTPAAEAGCIELRSTDTFNVYGVVLKEQRYKEFLSCYEDSGEIYSDHMPTTTEGANAGDMVGNIDLTSSGWKRVKDSWAEVFGDVAYSVEVSGGMVHLVGSDGSLSSMTTVPTARVMLNTIGCTASNGDAYILIGGQYETTLIPDEGNRLTSVVVMMDGVDVTASAYNSDTGKIVVQNVTGTIIITATATYAYVVPDLHGSQRCGWTWEAETGSFWVTLGNDTLALATTTENKFENTDRHGAVVYPIPIPTKASKVTVSHTDGIVYRYDFAMVKSGENGAKNAIYIVFDSDKNTYEWLAGEFDYILINCKHADGSEVPWDFDQSSVSVTFSNDYEEVTE